MELCRIAIVRDWATQHPLLIHSEVLLWEDNLAAFLPPMGHVVPSALGIFICSSPDSSRKWVSSFSLEGKGNKVHFELSRDDLVFPKTVGGERPCTTEPARYLAPSSSSMRST